MFLIFLALIASQKPLRDTTFIKTGNDTLWITGDKIWNSTGTITIEGTLSVSKVDSAIHADSAAWSDSTLYADSTGWANLFDGYSEDYFRDTNDVWRDSVHAYQEATDSLVTSKVKADIFAPYDSTDIRVGANVNMQDNDIDSVNKITADTVIGSEIKTKREPFVFSSAAELNSSTAAWSSWTAIANSSGSVAIKYNLNFSGFNWVDIDTVYLDSLGILYAYNADTVNVDSLHFYYLKTNYPEDETMLLSEFRSTDAISLDNRDVSWEIEFHSHTLSDAFSTDIIIPVGYKIYWTNPNPTQDCDVRTCAFVLYGSIVRNY